MTDDNHDADRRTICHSSWLQLFKKKRKSLPFTIKKHSTYKYEPERWVVFCVHDNRIPHLEWYSSPIDSNHHSRILRIEDLIDVARVYKNICNDCAFTIDFSDSSIHPSLNLVAINTQDCDAWVSALNDKLYELRCLESYGNLYSELPVQAKVEKTVNNLSQLSIDATASTSSQSNRPHSTPQNYEITQLNDGKEQFFTRQRSMPSLSRNGSIFYDENEQPSTSRSTHDYLQPRQKECYLDAVVPPIEIVDEEYTCDEPTHIRWPVIRDSTRQPAAQATVNTPRKRKANSQMPISQNFAETLSPREKQAMMLTRNIARQDDIIVKVLPDDLQNQVIFVEIGCHLWVAAVTSRSLSKQFYVGDRIVDIDNQRITKLSHINEALFNSDRLAGAQVCVKVNRMPHAQVFSIFRMMNDKQPTNIGIIFEMNKKKPTNVIAEVRLDSLAQQAGIELKPTCSSYTNDEIPAVQLELGGELKKNFRSSPEITYINGKLLNYTQNNAHKLLEFDDHGLLMLIVLPTDLMTEMRKQIKKVKNHQIYLPNE